MGNRISIGGGGSVFVLSDNVLETEDLTGFFAGLGSGVVRAARTPDAGLDLLDAHPAPDLALVCFTRQTSEGARLIGALRDTGCRLVLIDQPARFRLDGDVVLERPFSSETVHRALSDARPPAVRGGAQAGA